MRDEVEYHKAEGRIQKIAQEKEKIEQSVIEFDKGCYKRVKLDQHDTKPALSLHPSMESNSPNKPRPKLAK